MDRSIPSEGGKTLLNTRKQDVLLGVEINAATVKSTNKGKHKSGHVVPLKTMGSSTRTPNGSSNTNRNKVPGDSGPNKSSSTNGTNTRNNIDKRLTKAGGMTPKSTMSTEPDVPFVNGKTTTVHTEVNIYTYII